LAHVLLEVGSFDYFGGKSAFVSPSAASSAPACSFASQYIVAPSFDYDVVLVLEPVSVLVAAPAVDGSEAGHGVALVAPLVDVGSVACSVARSVACIGDLD